MYQINLYFFSYKQFKLVKNNTNFSAIVKVEVLSSHMWLVATALYRQQIENTSSSQKGFYTVLVGSANGLYPLTMSQERYRHLLYMYEVTTLWEIGATTL